MSLLAIPGELLFEIAIFVAGVPPPAPASSLSCDIFSLAQTCRTLRFVGLAIIYRTVNTKIKAGRLEFFLADFPDIAANIRTLTVDSCHPQCRYTPTVDSEPGFRASSITRHQTAATVPTTQPWPSQALLQNCTGLTELVIRQPPSRVVDASNSSPTCLEFIPIASRHTISTIRLQTFRLLGLLDHLQALLEGQFPALKTLSIETLSMANPPSHHETTRLAARLADLEALPLTLPVTHFTLDAPLPRPSHSEQRIGALFARVLPTVDVLSVTTGAACLYALLSGYAQAARELTHITAVVPRTSYQCGGTGGELCVVLASFEASVVEIRVCGEVAVCHRLLEGRGWRVLREMEVVCGAACEGLRVGVLRDCVLARKGGRIRVELGSGRGGGDWVGGRLELAK